MQLTFHTSAAPTREQGCEQSVAVGGEEFQQRGCCVCWAGGCVCVFCSVCFVLFYTVFPFLCVFCQDEVSLLTPKCGLLRLPGRRAKRKVNGGGLSLVVPCQEAPQLSVTSSDD